MKVNKWTAALASAGVLSGISAAQAEESPVMTALASTTISGFVDTAAHWNPEEQGSSYSTLPIYNKGASRKDDGFNLNVVNLQIAKPLDEGQWSAGYKAELLFGPDATGYNASNGSDGTSDFGVKQAYVELRAPVGNGLDFKMGVFDTIVGYEYANNNANPNYTRSWGWAVEPTQHTGLLASYSFDDAITVTGGVANTLSAGINNRAHPTKSETSKTALGAVAITAPESWGFMEGATLYGGAIYGFNASSADNQANYYAGLTIPTGNDKLSVGLAYDYVHNDGAPNTGVTFGDGNDYQNVYGAYVSFQATEKFSIHGRAEYATGDLISTTTSGEAADIYSGTITLQYDLWANVISRVEIRYDDVEDGEFFFGTKDDEQWLLAFNLIYSF
jgi:predicted porin